MSNYAGSVSYTQSINGVKLSLSTTIDVSYPKNTTPEVIDILDELLTIKVSMAALRSLYAFSEVPEIEYASQYNAIMADFASLIKRVKANATQQTQQFLQDYKLLPLGLPVPEEDPSEPLKYSISVSVSEKVRAVDYSGSFFVKKQKIEFEGILSSVLLNLITAYLSSTVYDRLTKTLFNKQIISLFTLKERTATSHTELTLLADQIKKLTPKEKRFILDDTLLNQFMEGYNGY